MEYQPVPACDLRTSAKSQTISYIYIPSDGVDRASWGDSGHGARAGNNMETKCLPARARRPVSPPLSPSDGSISFTGRAPQALILLVVGYRSTVVPTFIQNPSLILSLKTWILSISTSCVFYENVLIWYKTQGSYSKAVFKLKTWQTFKILMMVALSL